MNFISAHKAGHVLSCAVLSVLIAAAAVTPVYAEPDASPAQKDTRFLHSPSIREYPSACALILADDLTYTLNDDYSSVSTEHNAIKILNNEGADIFKSIPRRFSEGSEKVEIEYARTIAPDGKIYEVSPDQARIVNLIKDVPAYKSQKLFVVDFPHVETGSIIEYCIKSSSAPRADHRWWTGSYFQNDVPIMNSTFKVTVPASEKAFTFTNEPELSKPEVSEKDGRRTYSWTTKKPYDSPAEFINMPNSLNYYKYAAAAPFADWNAMADWAGSVWDKNTDDSKGELNMLSARITSVGKEPDEKINDILAHVGRHSIVDKDSEFWRPVNLAEVSKSKVISYADAAYLTGALLRKAGLRVTPYLMTTADVKNIENLPPIPTYVSQFMLKVVCPDGRERWIDPSLPGSVLSAPGLGWQGSAMLELPAGGRGQGRIVKAPQCSPEENTSLFNVGSRIENSGISKLSADISYTGPSANIVRTAIRQMSDLTPEQRREVGEWIAAKADNAFCFQLVPYASYFPEKFEEGKPVTFNTSVNAVNCARFDRESGCFETPLLVVHSQSLKVASLGQLKDRTCPVRFEAPFTDELTYTVDLPADSTVVSVPEDRNVSNEAGSYTCKTVVRGSQVWFYCRLQIKSGWYYPEQFGQLEELAKAQTDTLKQPLKYKVPDSEENKQAAEEAEKSAEESEQPAE